MCLYTKNPEIHTATQDIVCYKVMYPTYKGLVQDFFYKKNTLYRLRKALKLYKYDVGYHIVNEGFHSYIQKKDAEKCKTNCIAKGIPTIIVECIIPKGAKYIRGINGNDAPNYVSTSIKILEKI